MTTTLILILLLALAAAGLIRYVAHDRFAGVRNVTKNHDDLGTLHMRSQLVPRR